MSHSKPKYPMSNTSRKGFASMSPEKRSKIAQLGGKSVSSDRDHMAKIGSIGGRASGKSRSQKTSSSIVKQ